MNLSDREIRLARFAVRRYWNHQKGCVERAGRRGDTGLADHLEAQAGECVALYEKLGGDPSLLGSGQREPRQATS